MSAKPWLESLELLVKMVITVVVFLIWGILERRDNIRGQAWAAVKLAICA
jgi:hypothetical protein